MFVGKKGMPTDAELAKTLGEAMPLWTQAVKTLGDVAPDREWHSYSIKAGRALKVKKKDRVIVYLSPRKAYFLASFALGEKAVQFALRSDLPQATLNSIKTAKKYTEGTAVRVEVREPSDVSIVKTLAAIKAAS